jgi:soluble lytic murein transglycosylase-like protein
MDVTSTILTAAKIAHVYGALLLAICSYESSDFKMTYNPNDKGTPSHGICQIKEATARMVGFKGKTKDLMRPEINAQYAAVYLKQKLDQCDGDLCCAVASYNAGSFIESEKFPTYPKNYMYVKRVRNKANKDLQKRINCGSVLVKE